MTQQLPAHGRHCLAELIGTFTLVFCGTGAVVINQLQDGVITHSGIALTFGLVVLAMIQAIGGISGAHINPAVTIAFAVAGRFERRFVPGYLAAQFAGATLASFVLHGLFPTHTGLGGTMPTGSWQQSFVLEVLLTFFLMYVVLQVATGSYEQGLMAGVTVGSVVALEAMFAGPVCGASMNPARSIGPAIISGQWQHQWLYVAAPVLGALLAIPAFAATRNPDTKE